MLFVFQVDTGKMTTFDMSLALESVEQLKLHVERVFRIAVDKQVLLINGGEHLNPEKRVCSYAAGTDTNPIYLFSKTTYEDAEGGEIERPLPSYDFTEKVKEAAEMPATYATVAKRTELAQQFANVALEQVKFLEGLIHEQHMQQQGWAAVIANLDDLVNDLKARWERFQMEFNSYIIDRDSYLECLNNFKDDLVLLGKIPVLPVLIKPDNFVPEGDACEEEKQSESAKGPTSLLDWIAESDEFMDDLYDSCSKGLTQMDEKVHTILSNEVNFQLHRIDTTDMKELKGIGVRLSGLEQLLREAKKHVQEQTELAQSFLRNQSRASNLREPSILPDLCASHLQQLQVLLQNHNKLRDINRRCLAAKYELNNNLRARLQWIVLMENKLLELDSKLVFSFETLVALQRQLEILQQTHLAPSIYLSTIAEVVRRRVFSQSFLLWASGLACQLLTLQSDELARRKDFQAQFEDHFLSSLFPGMDDLPPSFATQAPSIFDSNLPKITQEDLDFLKKALPEFAEVLSVPDATAVTNFFLSLSKSVVKEDDVDKDNQAVKEKLMQAVTEAGVASNSDQSLLKAIEYEPQLTTAHGLPHLKDLDRGCESETDTEEFEKVGQSPFELHFDKGIPSPRPGGSDVSTLTEVGDRALLPPKKPPRTFQKPHLQDEGSCGSLQRTLSISGSQSNTESFTNIKNPSLESIDELSSLKNFGSNTESCYNSHHQQMQGITSSVHCLRSKSLSPHTPQSPKDIRVESPNSPVMGHQHNDFVNDEFYIDESLPSSLSIETGQSQGEFVKQLDTANNVVALLQDNLQESRSDVEKLQSTMSVMRLSISDTLRHVRLEIGKIREFLRNVRNEVFDSCDKVSRSVENSVTESENRQREIAQRLTVDHELEISDFRKIAQGKNEEIKSLREENVALKLQLQQVSEENFQLERKLTESSVVAGEQLDELKREIEELRLDKEKTVKEVSDRLKSEHRGEIESIRARFKLMTMERSPSENSLEKIERGDFTSLTTNPEALLLQMTENFESEKEVAVSDAVTKEGEKWHKLLDETKIQMQESFEKEKQLIIEDVGKKISEDKDKQIDSLREQMRNLSLECIKHRGTIQQLAEHSEESELLQRINKLKMENTRLETELEKCREKSCDLSTSIAVCEGKVDAVTSPIRVKRRSESSARMGKLNVESCKTGDLVLVMWDPFYKNFKVLQDSNCMYFLHSDCLAPLGLEVMNEQPNKPHCFGEVMDKEYCHARKVPLVDYVFTLITFCTLFAWHILHTPKTDLYSAPTAIDSGIDNIISALLFLTVHQLHTSMNRFRVPKGTKFFRVRVKPPTIKEAPPRPFHQATSALQQVHMSQSQTTTSPTTSEIVTGAGPSHSLPSSPTKTQSLCWESPPTSSIPEEKGEDSPVAEHPDAANESGGDIEKGTELTENFNVEIHANIDR